MRALLFLVLVLFVGCQPRPTASVESASPKAPAMTPQASPTGVGADALETIKGWQSADQAWDKVHPQVLKQVQEEDKERILLLFKSGIDLREKTAESLKLLPATAEQTLRRTFPVLPTDDVVLGENEVSIFQLKIEGSDWYLTPWLTSEAAAAAAKDPQTTPDEKRALALKILEALSPDQKALLNEEIQSGSKIEAIRALQEMDAHDLTILNLVIEKIAERQKD